MENAAKALLIAGGILLGIIVLSLFMLMLNSLTDYQLAQTQVERNQDVIAFNNQYSGYLRDGISGSDVISLINKVIFYNRTRSSTGEDENYTYEPITLKINFNGNNKELAMDGENNKLFKEDLSFEDTEKLNSKISDELDNGLDELDEILNYVIMPDPPAMESGDSAFPSQYNNRKLNLHYTEQILQGLLDNYNSTESIFDDEFDSLSEKDKRKRFSNFNLIIGKVFFPLINNKNKAIPVSTINKWWENYFSSDKASQKDKSTKVGSTRHKTIREELAYYYEYKQFQRGIFNYKQTSTPTYSSQTGRIIYMEFEFTGEFI